MPLQMNTCQPRDIATLSPCRCRYKLLSRCPRTQALGSRVTESAPYHNLEGQEKRRHEQHERFASEQLLADTMTCAAIQSQIAGDTLALIMAHIGEPSDPPGSAPC
jgi:hypothetical protein